MNSRLDRKRQKDSQIQIMNDLSAVTVVMRSFARMTLRLAYGIMVRKRG